MENATLGWLYSLLCTERPELTPAHLLPSLQADCSCPHGCRAEAAGRRQPGHLCSPLSPGISALSYAVHLPRLKTKLPLLIVDSVTTGRADTLRADFGNALHVAPLWTRYGFYPLREDCSGCNWSQRHNLTSTHWAYARASTPTGDAQLSLLHLEFRRNTLRFNLWI